MAAVIISVGQRQRIQKSATVLLDSFLPGTAEHALFVSITKRSCFITILYSQTYFTYSGIEELAICAIARKLHDAGSFCLHSSIVMYLFGESVALLVARRTNNQPTIGRLRVRGLLK